MNDTVYNMLIDKKHTNTMVFPSKQNTYICNKNLLKVWQKKLKNANIPYRKFHDLRHTFVTVARDKGIDPKTVMSWCGHSSERMIMQIYDHVTEDREQRMISLMDE